MLDLNYYANGQERKMDSFDQAPRMHIMRNKLLYLHIYFLFICISAFLIIAPFNDLATALKAFWNFLLISWYFYFWSAWI